MLNLMLSEMLNLTIIVEDYFRARDFFGDDRGKEQKATDFVLNSEQASCALCCREGTSSALQCAVSGEDPKSASPLATNKPLSVPLSQDLTSPGLSSPLNRISKLQVSSFKLSLQLLLHKMVYTIAELLIVFVLDCSISPTPKITMDLFWLLF